MPYGITLCYLYHPVDVTFPPLPQPKLVLEWGIQGGIQAELTNSGWLHTEMVYPPEDGHSSRN